MSSVPLCLIPACGSASRLGNVPKFMLPLPNRMSLLKRHLECARQSGFHALIATTPDYAATVYNYGANGEDGDNDSTFTVTVLTTATMSDTVVKMTRHLHLSDATLFALVMPDTYLEDPDALTKMKNTYTEGKGRYDAVLGVFRFRAEQRGKLGQVEFDTEDRLTRVVDKDPNCTLPYAWGTVLWGQRFHRLIDRSTPHIGYALAPALKAGLTVKVCRLEGDYYDCGTLTEYKQLLSVINS